MLHSLSWILIKTVAIVMVFGLAVFVHEFGHMFFAIIRGVGVESFAIGMGPKLLAWKWRGIEFSLRAFPVGGFVKLAGLMPGEEAEQEKEPGPETRAYSPAEQTNSIEMRLEREETIDALAPVEGKTLAESSYDDLMALSNKGLLTKLMVFGGGVFMNYVTAIVAMALLMALPNKVMNIPAKIYKIEEKSPAQLAGLRAGDEIVGINGRAVHYPYEIDKALSDLLIDGEAKSKTREELSSTTLTISLARADAGTSQTVRDIQLPAGHFIRSDITYALPPLVGGVIVGQPAQKAGLKKGDRILAVDGQAVNDFNELRALIHDKQGEELTIDYERDGGHQTVKMIPATDPQEPDKGLIGVEPGAMNYVKISGMPILEAIQNAPGATWDSLKRLIRLHINFFSKATLKQVGQGLGGPVLIARITADAAEKGLPDLVNFFITLNLLLMVFNLLPLPVLDGGFILISIVESIIRRPVPAKVLAPIYTAFMIFFIGMMLIISLFDIKNMFH